MAFIKNTYVYTGASESSSSGCEMINAFNRVWFGGLDTSPTSGNYGRLTSQSNNPRNIQLGLKVTF